MNYDDMIQMIRATRETMEHGEHCVQELACLVAGRLRKCYVSPSVLCELKRELNSWNMHTMRWRKH